MIPGMEFTVEMFWWANWLTIPRSSLPAQPSPNRSNLDGRVLGFGRLGASSTSESGRGQEHSQGGRLWRHALSHCLLLPPRNHLPSPSRWHYQAHRWRRAHRCRIGKREQEPERRLKRHQRTCGCDGPSWNRRRSETVTRIGSGRGRSGRPSALGFCGCGKEGGECMVAISWNPVLTVSSYCWNISLEWRLQWTSVQGMFAGKAYTGPGWIPCGSS